MIILVPLEGDVSLLYTEVIDLKKIGTITSNKRVSHVEPAPLEPDRWCADMSPVNGPVLGPFDTRSEALQAEERWLEKNYFGVDA